MSSPLCSRASASSRGGWAQQLLMLGTRAKSWNWARVCMGWLFTFSPRTLRAETTSDNNQYRQLWACILVCCTKLEVSFPISLESTCIPYAGKTALASWVWELLILQDNPLMGRNSNINTNCWIYCTYLRTYTNIHANYSWKKNWLVSGFKILIVTHANLKQAVQSHRWDSAQESWQLFTFLRACWCTWANHFIAGPVSPQECLNCC